MRSLEYRLQPDDQICFVRIPKTGSTTLISILDAQFHHSEICPVLVADLPQTTPDELAQYRLFRDHFDYDLVDFLHRPPVYVTMLRHPIDRAISYYEFCRRGQNSGPFDVYLRDVAQQGLAAFITHPDPTLRLRNANLQTRQIASGLGSRHRDPFTPDPREEHLSDGELLALAKAHLDEFAVIGLTERFNDSILLLSYVFGWYPVTDYQSLRVATKKSKRDELDPSTIDAILSVNALDMELYDYAQQIFQQQFDQMVQDLETRYGSDRPSLSTTAADSSGLLSSLHRHYETRYGERHLEPVRSLDFDVLQAMSGSGWHRRNGGFSGLFIQSTPFRWTGPSTTSTLDFPLAQNTDLAIRIHITNAAVPDTLDNFTLAVNDQPVALQTLIRRGNMGLFQGLIPKTALSQTHRPFTRLKLQVDRTYSLKDLNPASSDSRRVGLAIHRIQICPADQIQSLSVSSLFPTDDDAWTEVAQLLQSSIHQNDAIAASLEFSELFPQQYWNYTQSFDSKRSPTWVVIHKGYLQEVNFNLLQYAIAHYKPVFANAVFVVFSSRRDRARVERTHLAAFWSQWEQMLQEKTGGRSPLLTRLKRRWLS